jgi:hypothetical protein
MVNCGKIEILNALNQIKYSDIITNDWKDEMLEILSKKSKLNIEDLNDQLALGKTDENEIKNQKERLYKSFINGRFYSSKNFDVISNKEPFKSLFEKLIWGEYKNNNLYNAFILENGERVYKVKLLEEPKENFNVSILHTLDIDDRFEKVTTIISEPLFKQFKRIKFDCKNFKNQVTEISNFNGMFVVSKNFVEKILKANFKMNKEEEENVFNSLININFDLGFSCILEFNKPITLSQAYSNLGNVYFIKINDLIKDKGKFIYSKNNAVPATNVPARYFDFCMTSIVSSAQ